MAGRPSLLVRSSRDASGRDTGLIPIAIELKHKLTHAQEAADGRTLPSTAGVVYTRQELAHDHSKATLWSLAKAVFRSLDASVHQLVSHWLRSHACVEPFAIAMHRHISTMHPVSRRHISMMHRHISTMHRDISTMHRHISTMHRHISAMHPVSRRQATAAGSLPASKIWSRAQRLLQGFL